MEGTYERKQHFKLYKAKKQWLLAGITALGLLFGSTLVASAATPAAPTPNSNPTSVVTVQTPAQTTTPTSTALNTSSANPVSSAVAQTTQAAPVVTKEVNQTGHWYLEDDNHQRLGGWQNLSGNREAYYDPTTKQMQYGEKAVAGKWYYLNTVNGDVQTGWYRLPDGRQVYYDVQKGHQTVTGQGMLHGMQKVGKDTYYFDPGMGTQESGFKQVNGKTYYFSPSRIAGREVNINGHWYNFDANGVMSTGFTQLKDGRTVYYNGQGQMQYGEQHLNGKWYFFDRRDGHMAIGWQTLPDGRLVYYQLDPKGQGQGMLHGLSTVNDQQYYFDPAMGTRRTGLQTINGKVYYFNPSLTKNKEANVNGHWYFFGANGAMATGLTKLPDGRFVYYNSQGQMQYGEQKLNGHWYFFNQRDGHLVSGWYTLPDGRKVYYDVQKDGTGQGMLHGNQVINDRLYRFDTVLGTFRQELKNTIYFNPTTKQLEYFGPDGKLDRAMKVTLAGKTFQVDANGYLQLTNGENQVNGNWYLYDAKINQLKTGWQILGKRTVYYDPATAQMRHGEANINGNWYYLDPGDGHMHTGFTRLPDGRTVYYNAKGQMYYGELNNGGYWYYFHPGNGAMSFGFTKLPGGRLVYYNGQGHMIYGWQTINGQRYHFNETTGDASRGDVWLNGHEYIFDTGTGAQITNAYTFRLLSWFYHRIGKITYSMYGSRNGRDGTADCSGSVTQALYEASGVPYATLYNTDSLHGYLRQLGYRLAYENWGYTYPQVGDVIIWGRRGYSGGAFGHTGVVSGSGADAKMISTNYYTNGQKNTAVQGLPYFSYWAYDEYPYYYVYRR